MTSVADLLRPNDTVLVGSGLAEPRQLVDELVAASKDIGPLNIIQLMTGSQEAVVGASRDGVRLRTPSPGPRAQELIDTGDADLMVASLGQLSSWIRTGRLRVDVVLAQACRRAAPLPGVVVDVIDSAMETARARALEFVDALPEIPSDVRWSAKDADLVVESSYTLATRPLPHKDGRYARIGQLIASLIPDGATVEIGVGAALSQVSDALVQAGRRNLAVHSGLVTDWVMDLVEAGVVSRRLGCGSGASVVGTMVFGSPALYRWAHRNDRLRMVASDHSHGPAHLATLDNFFAINSALEVDIFGAVNVTRLGDRIRPSGGLLDFVAGASHAGTCVFAVPSHRIVARAQVASVPAEFVTHVVTEYGIADLRGLSPSGRANALIAIAHPDNRAALRQGEEAMAGNIESSSQVG
ncbi:acetyl-CoA hydrolase/transferase C-terminal domain-containing protein [Rhodococcus olei]|uniref:Acetyl-CoA hydrolase/transferase C-terminal domain-containing protein n=1 Tax=Rhodococcus olei TaxID=2161675 RepID=A0ABP8PS01_9NOCA